MCYFHVGGKKKKRLSSREGANAGNVIRRFVEGKGGRCFTLEKQGRNHLSKGRGKVCYVEETKGLARTIGTVFEEKVKVFCISCKCITHRKKSSGKKKKTKEIGVDWGEK